MIEYLLIAAGGYVLGRLFDGGSKETIKTHESRLSQLEKDANVSAQILQEQNYRLNAVEDLTSVLEAKIGAIVEGSQCPDCGRPMKLRKNRQPTSQSYGKFFFGCSGFPNYCKRTLSMPSEFVSQVAVRQH